MELDVISVLIVPEKKGLFLKHSEYEITSQKQRCTTFRRYNDFVHLHNLMLARSPFRMIPRLPPKQLMLDSLLEERRRGLQRWLRIIAKHPVLGADPLFCAFLSDTSAEHQDRLRHMAATEPDEYELLGDGIELPLEDQGRLAAGRETMRAMLGAVGRLRRLADQQAARGQAQAKDVAEMGAVLRLAALTEMATGFDEAAAVSDRCARHQQSSVSERFDALIEILLSHSDLCDRVERGTVSEHQRAMSKMLTLNKQRVKGVIRGTAAESVTAIHEKEVALTGVVGTLGRRTAFSLHCVLQETALAQEALKALPSIMLSFTYEQNQANTQMAKVWQGIVADEADKIK